MGTKKPDPVIGSGHSRFVGSAPLIDY
jgi:hypothetical protein